MSKITLKSSSLTMNTLSIAMKPNATVTPTINSLTCTFDSGLGDTFVTVPVVNNDSSSAVVEVSIFSNFPNNNSTQSTTVGGGGSTSFDFTGYSNPPGTVTFYARATVSGKSTSTTASRTQNMSLCFAI